MTARKCEECFVRSHPMRKISLQQSLDRPGRVTGFEIAKNLLPQIRVGPKTAACEQVIAFDGVVAVAGRNLCSDQADVADIMLRAGMVATCEMNVERRVDVHARLAPVADFGSMALRIGSGELAAGVAGARNQPGADL